MQFVFNTAAVLNQTTLKNIWHNQISTAHLLAVLALEPASYIQLVEGAK